MYIFPGKLLIGSQAGRQKSDPRVGKAYMRLAHIPGALATLGPDQYESPRAWQGHPHDQLAVPLILVFHRAGGSCCTPVARPIQSPKQVPQGRT